MNEVRVGEKNASGYSALILRSIGTNNSFARRGVSRDEKSGLVSS